MKTRKLHYVYIRCNGETAFRRRGPGDIWQGLWEPFLAAEGESFPGQRLLRKEVRHQLTHRLLIADFSLLECGERPVLPDGYVWIKEAELDRYAKPRLIEILLGSLPD